ncbi:MAG: hypothetical protein PHT21_01125 [Lachnospiraceae bacterium]|nr:hypothetical protein [Lachnospiraceae bacterium]
MYIGAYQGTMQSERVYSEKTEYSEKKENISFTTGSKQFDETWEKTVLSGLKRTSKQDEDQKQMIRTKCTVYLLELLFRTRNGRLWSDEYFLKEIPQSASTQGNAKVMNLTQSYYHEESETTSFEMQGKVITKDGRELSFELGVSMSRSFREFYQTEQIIQELPLCDPLVINLDSDMAEVSDQKIKFDLDADGIQDSISRLSSKSGYLALDHNQNGKIDNGTELFGTSSGNGFADLEKYDEDHNGWIDEADAVWKRLSIWCEDKKGSSTLYKLSEKGIGAICLQHVDTAFSLHSDQDNQVNARIQKTGVFLYESGVAGTIQHVDLATRSGYNTGYEI